MKLIRLLATIDKAYLRLMLLAITAGIIAVVVFLVWGYNTVKEDSITVSSPKTINATPTIIEQMKEIGQWEFLTISDEELIDTLRRGFFSDDELVRIYYGTLRLGIDFKDCSEEWIKDDKDTIHVTLPPIRLLNDRFIDEAKTKSFFEIGKWSNKDRQQLYTRAHNAMKRRCLTKENLQTATDNATIQVKRMLQPMTEKPIKVVVP